MLNTTAGRYVKSILIPGLVFRFPPKWPRLIWLLFFWAASRLKWEGWTTKENTEIFDLPFNDGLTDVILILGERKNPFSSTSFKSQLSHYWHEVMVDLTRIFLGELQTSFTKMALSFSRRLTKNGGNSSEGVLRMNWYLDPVPEGTGLVGGSRIIPRVGPPVQPERGWGQPCWLC